MRDGGETVSVEDIDAVVNWDPKATPSREIAFRPSRVLLQDFTGVPAWSTWPPCATPCQAWAATPQRINPLEPVDLVIDHSVQVDHFGTPRGLRPQRQLEFERNASATSSCVGPESPSTTSASCRPAPASCHQVNLEYLARVDREGGRRQPVAYPDTLVGTDSTPP
jgi:aconitate hydratase